MILECDAVQGFETGQPLPWGVWRGPKLCRQIGARLFPLRCLLDVCPLSSKVTFLRIIFLVCKVHENIPGLCWLELIQCIVHNEHLATR